MYFPFCRIITITTSLALQSSVIELAVPSGNARKQIDVPQGQNDDVGVFNATEYLVDLHICMAVRKRSAMSVSKCWPSSPLHRPSPLGMLNNYCRPKILEISVVLTPGWVELPLNRDACLVG
jgi:hypothetical protein